jgi:hypothetical protein
MSTHTCIIKSFLILTYMRNTPIQQKQQKEDLYLQWYPFIASDIEHVAFDTATISFRLYDGSVHRYTWVNHS